MRLGSKLLIALLSIGLPLLILTYINYAVSEKALLEARVDHLETVADKKVQQIEAFFERARTTATVGQHLLNARKNIPIVSSLYRTLDSQEYRRVKKEIDLQFRPFVKARPEVLDVLFVRGGDVVYSANASRHHPLGRPLPEPFAKVAARAAGGVQVSAPCRNTRDQNRLTLVAAGAVMDAERLMGVIVFEIDIERLLSIVMERTGLGTTGETLLAQQAGDAIAFLHARRRDRGDSPPRVLPVRGPVALPMQHALRGQSGSGLSVDYHGTRVIAAWRPVPLMHGGLVAKIDASEAFASADRLRSTTAVLALVFALMLALVALVLARTIAKPILLLQAATQRLAAGDLTCRIGSPYTRDDVGSLARSFDTMAEHLQATTASRDELEERERQLELSEEKLRVLFDGSTELITLADEKANPLMVNPAWRKVFGPALEAEANPFERIHPDDVASVRRAWESMLDRREAIDGLEYRYKVGERFRHFESSAFPVSIAGDTRYYVVARDVTDRVLAAEEMRLAKAAAERSNRELEAFAHSVSHDLRAPLRGMDGFSRALLEGYADLLDSKGRHYLERVRAGAITMGQLIDGLLGLSRISRAHLRREACDVADIARAVAASLRELEPGREVELIIPDRLVANADRRLLVSVLQNLLGNAWKFTAKEAVARIELGVTEQREHFVRDNGAGFEEAYADKLFGAFQRLHATSEFDGLGIGLATVRRIIHLHGGRVRAEGELGRGAAFYFTLE